MRIPLGDVPMRRPEWLAERGGKVELLRVPALLFGAAAGLRARLYDKGILPVAKLDVPVVSVGNLSTGGTGKTPFVAHVCRELLARGRRPGILSRGYGTKESEANDEERVLASELPDVPHVADPDRVRGGSKLLEETGCDVIVLDDGFQHRRLWRDLDLVLVDATRPWGLPAPSDGGEHVRAVLPRGLLRENPRSLARAHAVIVTRSDQLEPSELEHLLEELEGQACGVPVLLAAHAPESIRALRAPSEPQPPGSLAGKAVELVSGIGNPEAFAATVRALGAEVVSHRAFPDHHAYTAGDLDGLGQQGHWIVTTEKDAVKLEALPDTGAPTFVLGVTMRIVRGEGVLSALIDALRPGAKERERRGIHEGLHG